MKNKTGLLFLMLLILTNSSFSQQSDSFSPEATAAEATGSFWDIPYLKETFIDARPADRNDGIEVGELGVDGGNKDMIVKLAQKIADSTYGDYDSMLITQKGKLLFESYYKRGRINLPHFQASATKSYTSLVLSRAIQLGYLTMADLENPLVSFLIDLDQTKFVKGIEKITLHQAMTMSSGLRFSDEEITNFRENPEQFKGIEQIQAFLEFSEPVTSESQSYKYRGNDPIMAMQVLDAVVPGSAKDFIKNELLDKLGINNYSWRNDLSGLPSADSGLSLTSRDMLKLGALVINKGQWNGEQLLSVAYLAKATSAITKPTEDWQPETFFYGYLWYQTDMTVGDKSYNVNIAWGAGGNRIILIEALDLVVVITGHDREDSTIMDQVSKTILPAFVTLNIGNHSDSQDKSPVVEDRYFGEKPPGIIPQPFAPAIVSPEGLFEGGKFSPDMKKFYFSRKNGKYKERTFFVIRYENGSWGNESETELKWPRFSKGGDTLYRGNKYRDRTDRGWSELKSLGAPFTDMHIMGISFSDNGNSFFDQYKSPDTVGAISYSRIIDGKYEPRQKMGAEINTGTWIAHPHIAPDESYLLWDVVREDGYGGSDLYISFRQKDGSWVPAINMGAQINTELQESGAHVSLDGKYLFFSRGEEKLKEDGSTYWEGRPYWVDAQVIENLRPKNNIKTKSTSYTIAYNSRETGNVEIYLGDTQGKSTIKSTNSKGVYLAWSPDGKQFAFYHKYDERKTWSIHTMNSDGTNRQRLTHEKNKWDNSPAWSPDGTKIVFAREYWDLEKNWHPEIWVMNADGSEQTQIKSLRGGGPFISPDGSIVFHTEFKDKKSEISIADIDGNNLIHLTDNEAEEQHPEISPDGKQIVFMSNRDGNHEIYVMNIDGSNQKRITNNDVDDWYPSWSPDGSQLIFSSHRDSEKDIYIMYTDGSSLRKIIANATSPAWLKIAK